jgi:hypothetical protein
MRPSLVLPFAAGGLLACVLVFVAVVHGPVTVSDLPDVLAFTGPVGLLVLAGWLSRGDRTPGRHATTAAAVLVLVLLTLLVWCQAVRTPVVVMPPLPGWVNKVMERFPILTLPAVLTALVPAVVGWWQRRRDRLADPVADA